MRAAAVILMYQLIQSVFNLHIYPSVVLQRLSNKITLENDHDVVRHDMYVTHFIEIFNVEMR